MASAKVLSYTLFLDMNSEDFRGALIEWYGSHGRTFWWRSSHLGQIEGLLIELLLRRTTAHQVSDLRPSILETLIEWAGVGFDDEHVAPVLKPLGLVSQRCQALKAILYDIETKHDGKVPEDLSSLLSLPHVGPYVANAVRCFYMGKPAPIVDCNVGRLFSRFFGFRSRRNPVRQPASWLTVCALLDKQRPKTFGWALLDLSAAVCTHAKPRCTDCPLRKGCRYFGSSDWRGLSSGDRDDALSAEWKFSQVPERLAELSGSATVPSGRKALSLLRLTEAMAVPEQAVRQAVLDRYCTQERELVSWVIPDAT